MRMWHIQAVCGIDNMDVVKNFEAVKNTLAKAPAQFGLPPRKTPPTLIVVTKTQSAENILPLLELGHRDFGENRVQEAAEKFPALIKRFPDIRLHLIGALQSNKAKQALELCSHIHTLDRPSLLTEITKYATPQHKILIQVNTGNEPQKAGVSPLDTPNFIKQAKEKLGETLCGLMCIPPQSENPAPHFALLNLLAKQNNLQELSVGMSSDYALATALNATYIRVGSAIFGERNSSHGSAHLFPEIL